MSCVIDSQEGRWSLPELPAGIVGTKEALTLDSLGPAFCVLELVQGSLHFWKSLVPSSKQLAAQFTTAISPWESWTHGQLCYRDRNQTHIIFNDSWQSYFLGNDCFSKEQTSWNRSLGRLDCCLSSDSIFLNEGSENFLLLPLREIKNILN